MGVLPIFARTISPMKRKVLKDLEDEIISCARCRLAASRQHAVPGEGPEMATVLLIGEAPGREEDRAGRPFVGRAGAILTSLLSIAGLGRDGVYITSVIKCRPPDNRMPKRDEITTCCPYLERQIALIKPQVIVPMGRVATIAVSIVLGVDIKPIGNAHGKAVTATVPWGEVIVLPTYHPAAMTHNPRMREPLERDFAALKVVLGNHLKRDI